MGGSTGGPLAFLLSGALLTLMVLPVLVLCLLRQRQFVQSIAASWIKG